MHHSIRRYESGSEGIAIRLPSRMESGKRSEVVTHCGDCRFRQSVRASIRPSVRPSFIHSHFDVRSPDPVSASRWFTRGFTLQELIVPTTVKFLDAEWTEVGTKESLKGEIAVLTGIPEVILSGKKELDSMSIAQRMSWAAHRKASRIEDGAYCLLGIFDINIPLIYGEG